MARHLWCFAALLCALFCSCFHSVPPGGLGEETPYPDEAQWTERIIELQKKFMDRESKGGTMKRDAHPKHHGCLKAEFIVEDNVEPDLRHGIFAAPGTFRAWLRFSNASPHVQNDDEPDGRGLAIKLMGVDGEKLLTDGPDGRTQDFLLLSNPALPTANIEDAFHLAQAIYDGNPAWFFLNPLHPHPRELAIVMALQQQHGNPLMIRYWSTTPYRLGDGAVKYSVRPCNGRGDDAIPQNAAADFLRDAMKNTLSGGEACLEFMVQRQTDAQQMPIEDAAVEWDEKASPFKKVATISIPAQAFDTPAQMEFCEHLSFTPWHSLAAHRPLGSVNRGRREIYRQLSRYRHDANGAAMVEPTDW